MDGRLCLILWEINNMQCANTGETEEHGMEVLCGDDGKYEECEEAKSVQLLGKKWRL